MPELDLTMLSVLVFLPAIFAAGLLLFPSRWVEPMRWFALFGAATTVALSLCVVVEFYLLLDHRSDANGVPRYATESRLDARADQAATDAAHPIPKALQSRDLVARRAWIARFGIQYALGVDGINLPLVVLTALVTFLALAASWKISHAVRGYLILILLLETGVIGAFLSLDFFLFYVFYELMLLPMYALIGIWGGQRRRYAALKFVLYTLLGSVGLLVAMIGLYSANLRDFVPQGVVWSAAETEARTTGTATPEQAWQQPSVHTFDIATWQRAGRAAFLVQKLGVEQAAERVVAEQQEAIKRLPDRNDSDRRFQEQLQKLVNTPEHLAGVRARLGQSLFTPSVQYLFFALLFIGFAVKVPVIPLHSWLPDAHVEAPTPVSMILAGVLLKLGGYGLIRVAFPVCPWAAAELAWWVGLIGVIGIVYGALLAMAQTDFKKLLAYSSISHMGFVVLGLASWSGAERAQYWQWGVNGAMFQMVAHGITASALFFVVGVIYDRGHHRDVNRFGGLMEPMPLFAGMSAILFFASMGLPGLCGFVGEFMVLMAAWNFSPALAIPAILSVILTAGYLLWTWQRVYLGTNPATASYPDLSPREAACLLPFVILAIALGILPQTLIFNWMDPSVTGWVASMATLK